MTPLETIVWYCFFLGRCLIEGVEFLLGGWDQPFIVPIGAESYTDSEFILGFGLSFKTICA